MAESIRFAPSTFFSLRTGFLVTELQIGKHETGVTVGETNLPHLYNLTA